MAAEAGSFAPNEEVDELRWLSLEEAAQMLSYPRDGELVAVLMAADQVEPVDLDPHSGFSEILCLPGPGSGIMGCSDLPPDRTAGVRAPVESSRTYRQGPCDNALTSIDWGTVGASSLD